jgi:hypothetical protein
MSADPLAQAIFNKEGCQWMGPEVDPLRDYPAPKCGHKVLEGSSWCGDHYWRVYKKGSSTAGRRKEKAIEKEIADIELQQLIAEQENDNE